ncbi:MAG: glycosyltransferase [Chloroflexi bacterium]|nr:MAG: glycosyltransferase [Chloroflexota bacterium]MBL1193148.1 glycosyltransferase [Chloroflexota bacterium]NOH10441.1 glycosyltransferase [Chloroflexota bacterium]
MAKILIVGNPSSPLIRQRGLIGQLDGHEIFWFSAVRAELPEVQAFGLPAIFSKSFLARAVLEPLLLMHAIRLIKPDLIHVHYASKGFSAIPLARFHPLVVSTMGSDIAPTVAYRGIYAPFIKYLLDHADRITTKSLFMDETLLEIGDFAHKIERVTWGIDLNHFVLDRSTKELRKEWSIPEKEFVFFDPRAARPLYNKHLILQAFAEYLKQADIPATLLVAEFNADKKYLSQLKDLAREMNVMHKVRFIKDIPPDNMADYLSLADIVISIPSSDGFPQTLYEAMACGSFLIVSNMPQYQHVFEDGITAKFVEGDDVDSIVDGLVWAVSHSKVRQRARALGREYVELHANRQTQNELVNQMYADLIEVRG